MKVVMIAETTAIRARMPSSLRSDNPGTARFRTVAVTKPARIAAIPTKRKLIPSRSSIGSGAMS
jgi:hypothetical protein